MLTIKGLAEAEQFVSRQSSLGNDVRWDGWDMVFFRPDPRGVYSAEDGAVKDGVYGFNNRVVVSEKGTWEVDFRNVKRAKRVGVRP